MGYGDCDLGVTLISYKADRNTFIDYTMPVEEDGVLWVSKTPQKLPSFTNIIMIFDSTSWLCILISIVLVTLAIIIITSLHGIVHLYNNMFSLRTSNLFNTINKKYFTIVLYRHLYQGGIKTHRTHYSNYKNLFFCP